MFDPFDFENRPLFTRLQKKRRAAFGILLFENLAQALWRPVFWILLFSGLWMIQLPNLFGTIGPGLFLALFVGGLGYFIWRDVRAFKMPDRHAVDRRMEQASAMRHRPLATLEDELSNPRLAETRTLWKSGKRRAIEAIAALRIPAPKAFLTKADPAALRILVLLVFITGLVVSGAQATDRVRDGLLPYDIKMPGPGTDTVTMWINAPAYTGRDTIILSGGRHTRTLALSEGSIVKARIQGGWGRPVLTMGDEQLEFTRLEDNNWSLETAVADVEQLQIRQGLFTRATVPISYMPDQPPSIALEGEPEILSNGQMEFALNVEDDYGVTELEIHMELDPDAGDAPLGQAITETRPISSPPGQAVTLSPTYDLTWHTWAGLPVVIKFTARDYTGQSATTEPLHIVLPERTFRHPVARAIIAERKKLAWTPETSARRVAYALETILAAPDTYQHEIPVFLSLRSAASRLIYGNPQKAAIDVIPQLWDTALKIEDGDLTLARRELQRAQQNLQKLLNNPDSTPEEIARAMDELRTAMSEFFREMIREMQKKMADNPHMMALPPEAFMRQLNAEDLASFMDQLQAEALSGDRQNAREMLSQLEQAMNMLDPSRQVTELPQDMQFMREGYNELQELIDRQKELLAQTEEQARLFPNEQSYPEFLPLEDDLDGLGGEVMPPPPQRRDLDPTPPCEGESARRNAQCAADTSENKVEQDALRYVLGQLMLRADEQTGQIPEGMQRAEQAMRQSAGELGENRPGRAIPHQEEALDELQNAQNDLNQQFQARMQQMMMFQLGGGRTDPLGRPMREGTGPEWLPNSRVQIPDEATRRRVQDILQKLRQRSGEVNRPDYELEYFRRLMRQF